MHDWLIWNSIPSWSWWSWLWWSSLWCNQLASEFFKFHACHSFFLLLFEWNEIEKQNCELTLKSVHFYEFAVRLMMMIGFFFSFFFPSFGGQHYHHHQHHRRIPFVKYYVQYISAIINRLFSQKIRFTLDRIFFLLNEWMNFFEFECSRNEFIMCVCTFVGIFFFLFPFIHSFGFYEWNLFFFENSLSSSS